MQAVDADDPSIARVLSYTSEANHLVSERYIAYLNQQERGHNSFQSGKVFEGDRGRPQYNISKEQLTYFIGFGFKATQIAEMLGVSESTVRRRLQEYNLSAKDYTTISDGSAG